MEYLIIYLFVFLVGIMIGSFLNVCIYRIPVKETIVKGRSACRSCGTTLKWYELIPLLSYVLQRGKCNHCKRRISVQYPLVELGCGLIYVWVFMVNGFDITGLLFCACASILIVIAIIDMRTLEIPIGCNVLIGILGMIRLFLDLTHWYDYVLGFFAVSGLFWLIFFVTKGNGMGGGDVKLMAAAGLFLGWKGIILALMIASIAGSIIHISLMLFCKKGRELAFGPYLAVGIFMAMLYGEKIIAWYLGLLGL